MPERCEGFVVVVAGRAQVGHHHSPRVATQAVLVSRVGLILYLILPENVIIGLKMMAFQVAV